MKKSIEFNFNGKTFNVDIHDGHVWLNLEGGVSVPLQMNNGHTGRYAYLTALVEGWSHEVRIYDDGEVYGA